MFQLSNFVESNCYFKDGGTRLKYFAKDILERTCVTYKLKASAACFAFALLSVLPNLLYADSVGKVDSLTRIIKTSRDLKQVMRAKGELAWHYLMTDDEQSLMYAEEAFDLALQFSDSVEIVRSGRIKGQALRRLGRLQDAIPILLQVLPISARIGFIEERKKILNALAVAYTFRAEYDKALDYNFQSLLIREAEGNKAEISVALNNIGLVYFKLHNYEGALKYYQECLDLKLETGDRTDLEGLYLNIGLCFIHLKKFKEARVFTMKGLESCLGNCSDKITMTGEYGLGECSYWLDDLEDAEVHLMKSFELAEKSNDARWQAENLVYLGALHNKKKEYDTAIAMLLRADSIARVGGYNQIVIDCYKHLSGIYRTLKDYERAAYFQEKLIHLSDTLIGNELIRKIAKIQSNFAERENIAKIASKEVVIQQAREFNIAVTLVALLTGSLVLVLFFANRDIKRANAKLSEAKEVIQRQNKELEYKNRELDIEVDRKTIDLARANQSLKQVNDELDNFIYKTSHDIRGPLASLKGICNVALMDVTDPLALEYLHKLDATAERLNSILTRLVIINQINNSKLTVKEIDFRSVVSDVMLLERKKGLPPDLTINTHIDKDIDVESDPELVRIVLENLIDNAIKFYNDSERIASFINVTVTGLEAGGVKVRVIDNGIGVSEASPGKLFQMFSRASERSETGGIGLYITKTATEKIGGRVGLLTTPEGYTEFYVILPRSPFADAARSERRVAGART